MRLLSVFVVLLTVLFVFAAFVPAQTVTGSVSGTVLDGTGSAILQAKAALVSETTAAVREATTDEDGNFVFNAISPGFYTLNVEFSGFKKYTKKNIELVANQNLALGQIRLEVGNVAETVTVVAEGATVQIASGERSGMVTSEEVENLTVVNRDFAVLVSLQPGVVDNPGDNVQSFSGNASFNVLGGRSNANNITIDGASTENTNGGNPNNYVSMDSVQAVKILVSNFQAEFGRKPGAGIMAVSKAGTQKYHGTGWYYKRHEMFNANDFFSNQAGRPQAPYRYVVAGGNIGGPLKLPKLNTRNKLFFFLNSEQLTDKRPQDIRKVTVPTAKERMGDFSDTRESNGTKTTTVYDPATSRPDPKKPGSYLRDPFPDNIIPAERLNPNMVNYLKLLPLPNFFNTALTQFNSNYWVQESLNRPKTMETFKVDYNIDPKTTVSGRFNYWWERQQGWAVSAGNPNWGWLPNTYKNWTRSLVLSGTRIISPTMILEGSASVMRWIENGAALNKADTDRLNRKTAGVNVPQFHPENNALSLVPKATFGGVSNAANPSYNDRFPLRGAETTFTYSSSLSDTHGPHVSKLGIYAERWRATKGEYAANWAGTFAFDRDSNSPFDANQAYANSLLGNFKTYTESSTRPPLYEYTTSLEWFAQDNWKVSRKLTLDVGLRFGWSQPFHSNRRQEAGFLPERYDPAKRVVLIEPWNVGASRLARNPVTGEVLPAVLIGAITPGVGDPYNGTVVLATDKNYPDGLRNNSGIKAAPRFGFAYDPFGRGKTAIRGGFGLFYEIHEKDIWGYHWDVNPPRQLNPQIFYGNLDSLFNTPAYLFSSNTGGVDRGRALGRTMNYSFGVQHQFGRGTMVDVAYVASLGRHLMQRRDLNSLPLGTRFLPSSQDPTSPGKPLPDPFLRPYPGYGSINYTAYDGNSSYHSLQLQVQRRMAKGLNFGFAWTWSKAMDYSDNDTSNVSNQISPKIWNYGKAGFDVTHVVKTWWIYSVPRVSRAWNNVVVRKLFDDWQVSGINSFLSGRPAGIGLSWANGSIDATGSTDGARVVVLHNPIIPKMDRTFGKNLDTDAFAAPAVGTWGNAPKDVIRGPGINNWDISLFKNFRAGPERLRWQFRGESYNTFNHTQFSGLDTGARFDTKTLQQVNAQFGQFTSARNPRRLQLALRLNF